MIPFLRITALASLFSSLALWYFHGARMGLWKTSIETINEVPIVEGMPELGVQQKITWTDQFVSGLETPIAGFVVFLLLFILSKILKRRLKNSAN